MPSPDNCVRIGTTFPRTLIVFANTVDRLANESDVLIGSYEVAGSEQNTGRKLYAGHLFLMDAAAVRQAYQNKMSNQANEVSRAKQQELEGVVKPRF
jgi:hypothetical protein